MLSSEADRLLRVIVCTPQQEYCGASDLGSHNIMEAPDPQRALAQHDGLKRCLVDFGAEVIDVSELAGHPNSVFTRDTALCTPCGYVQLRMGLESRRGEEGWMGGILDSLGEPCVGQIQSPGTVEGGDVVLAGPIAFVGRSVRTNDLGIEQLTSLLAGMDYEVRVIPLPESILHLDKALMLVAPDRAIYCAEFVPQEYLAGFHTFELRCDGPATANIICLGDNEVIVEQSNIEVAQRLRAEGVVVHELDLSEFVKGSGGPNCLILPVERGKSAPQQSAIC
jgi:dimethylargininase